ncbi:unnamed protein product [Amoebophrya sp. A120]|nr:unnamed protein product [Amoebophrya sp. A120]|eukprot:GSA120T00025671001.1
MNPTASSETADKNARTYLQTAGSTNYGAGNKSAGPISAEATSASRLLPTQSSVSAASAIPAPIERAASHLRPTLSVSHKNTNLQQQNNHGTQSWAWSWARGSTTTAGGNHAGAGAAAHLAHETGIGHTADGAATQNGVVGGAHGPHHALPPAHGGQQHQELHPPQVQEQQQQNGTSTGQFQNQKGKGKQGSFSSGGAATSSKNYTASVQRADTFNSESHDHQTGGHSDDDAVWVQNIYEFMLALQEDADFRKQVDLPPLSSLSRLSSQQPQDPPQKTKRGRHKVEASAFFRYLRTKGILDDDNRVFPVRVRAKQVLDCQKRGGKWFELYAAEERHQLQRAASSLGSRSPALSFRSKNSAENFGRDSQLSYASGSLFGNKYGSKDGQFTGDTSNLEDGEATFVLQGFPSVSTAGGGTISIAHQQPSSTSKLLQDDHDNNYFSAATLELRPEPQAQAVDYPNLLQQTEEDVVEGEQHLLLKDDNKTFFAEMTDDDRTPLTLAEEKDLLLSQTEFIFIVRGSPEIIARACANDFVMKDFDDFQTDCFQIYQDLKDHCKGAKASYIPQLQSQNENWWAVAACTVDGQRLAIGDFAIEFCLQSCSKTITYGAVLEGVGVEQTHRHVGCEPSGMIFNALALDRNGLPHNPLINSGAIMCAGIYFAAAIERKMESAKKMEEQQQLEIERSLKGSFDEEMSQDLVLENDQKQEDDTTLEDEEDNSRSETSFPAFNTLPPRSKSCPEHVMLEGKANSCSSVLEEGVHLGKEHNGAAINIKNGIVDVGPSLGTMTGGAGLTNTTAAPALSTDGSSDHGLKLESKAFTFASTSQEWTVTNPPPGAAGASVEESSSMGSSSTARPRAGTTNDVNKASVEGFYTNKPLVLPTLPYGGGFGLDSEITTDMDQQPPPPLRKRHTTHADGVLLSAGTSTMTSRGNKRTETERNKGQNGASSAEEPPPTGRDNINMKIANSKTNTGYQQPHQPSGTEMRNRIQMNPEINNVANGSTTTGPTTVVHPGEQNNNNRDNNNEDDDDGLLTDIPKIMIEFIQNLSKDENMNCSSLAEASGLSIEQVWKILKRGNVDYLNTPGTNVYHETPGGVPGRVFEPWNEAEMLEYEEKELEMQRLLGLETDTHNNFDDVYDHNFYGDENNPSTNNKSVPASTHALRRRHSKERMGRRANRRDSFTAAGGGNNELSVSPPARGGASNLQINARNKKSQNAARARNIQLAVTKSKETKDGSSAALKQEQTMKSKNSTAKSNNSRYNNSNERAASPEQDSSATGKMSNAALVHHPNNYSEADNYESNSNRPSTALSQSGSEQVVFSPESRTASATFDTEVLDVGSSSSQQLLCQNAVSTAVPTRKPKIASASSPQLSPIRGRSPEKRGAGAGAVVPTVKLANGENVDHDQKINTKDHNPNLLLLTTTAADDHMGHQQHSGDVVVQHDHSVGNNFHLSSGDKEVLKPTSTSQTNKGTETCKKQLPVVPQHDLHNGTTTSTTKTDDSTSSDNNNNGSPDRNYSTRTQNLSARNEDHSSASSSVGVLDNQIINNDDDVALNPPQVLVDQNPMNTLGDYVDQCLREIQQMWSRLGGRRKVGYDEDVFLSEAKTADRNFALAYYLKENRAYPDLVNGSHCGRDSLVNEVLDFYFKLCALTVDCETLAIAAATLANGGVCPTTGERVLKTETVKHILSMMYSCGMYDYSGEFAFRIGLPAKSGVAGGIMVVVPNLLGFATFSPPLDKYGNSERGREFFSRLINVRRFHNFDITESGGGFGGGGAGTTSTGGGGANISAAIGGPGPAGGGGGPQQRTSPTTTATDQPPRTSLIGSDRGDTLPAWLFDPKMHLIQLAAVGDLVSFNRMRLSGTTDFYGQDYDQRTPLHLAASNGHLSVVRFLLDNGHPLDMKDRWGGTPLDDALRENHETVANFLMLHYQRLQG